MTKLNRKIIRKMILQEVIMIKKEHVLAENNLKIARFCAIKERKMLAEGYSRMEVNEGIFGDILGGALGLAKDSALGAPGGFMDTIEQMLIEKILEKLFGSYDPDSFLGSVISNVIENIDITEIGKYFGEGACEPIVETLYKGITEAILQQGFSKLFGSERSDSSFIGSVVEESFINAINSVEFQQNMKTGLKDVICNQNFAGIFDTLSQGMDGIFSKGKDYLSTTAIDTGMSALGL